MKELIDALVKVQSELKAPKGQYNSFAKYHYRSAEDIIVAAKPLCNKYGLALTLIDEVIQIGDRYFLKATTKLLNGTEEYATTGLAEIAGEKKGMDVAQITGAASSYARKYALNGLFAIDDAKDADTDEHHQQTQKKPAVSKGSLVSQRKQQLLAEFDRLGIELPEKDDMASFIKKAIPALTGVEWSEENLVQIISKMAVINDARWAQDVAWNGPKPTNEQEPVTEVVPEPTEPPQSVEIPEDDVDPEDEPKDPSSYTEEELGAVSKT